MRKLCENINLDIKAVKIILAVGLTDFESLFSSYIVQITFKLINQTVTDTHDTFIQYKEQTSTQKDFPPLAANLPQNIGRKLFNKLIV